MQRSMSKTSSHNIELVNISKTSKLTFKLSNSAVSSNSQNFEQGISRATKLATSNLTLQSKRKNSLPSEKNVLYKNNSSNLSFKNELG